MEDEYRPVIDFWFRELAPRQWFAEAAQRSTDSFANASAPSWRRHGAARSIIGPCRPAGALAPIILLDQFSGMSSVGMPEAYSGDTTAQALATEGIEASMDEPLTFAEREFFYMPLDTHAENRDLQALSLERFELREAAEAGAGFASNHRRYSAQSLRPVFRTENSSSPAPRRRRRRRSSRSTRVSVGRRRDVRNHASLVDGHTALMPRRGRPKTSTLPRREQLRHAKRGAQRARQRLAERRRRAVGAPRVRRSETRGGEALTRSSSGSSRKPWTASWCGSLMPTARGSRLESHRRVHYGQGGIRTLTSANWLLNRHRDTLEDRERALIARLAAELGHDEINA